MNDIILGHNPDTRRFASAFFAEDDIGAIIRCHFEVEQAANRELDVLTNQRWRRVRSQYLSDKLNLLEMIGVPSHLLAPARTLNNQRNGFAHDGAEEITEQQMLDLLRGFRALMPQFNDDYEIAFRGRREFTAKFRDCTIRQKYVVTAATLAFLIGGLPELVREPGTANLAPA